MGAAGHLAIVDFDRVPPPELRACVLLDLDRRIGPGLTPDLPE
jgi:hypothetical protein